MVYKTLMLQLYKPSKHKRDLIDKAFLRYSQALQFLMDRYKEEIEELSKSKEDVTQRRILNMVDKETAKSLNQFGAQPFKDSLKIEFACVAASYIAQKRNHVKAGYPLLFLDASLYPSAVFDCINRFDLRQINRHNLACQCSKLTAQVGRLRPIYFGRYAMNRNYCLLYDKYKDRFYAKLYLLNLNDSLPSGNWTSGLSLEYIWNGMPPLLNKPGSRRYLVVPLSFGKKQYAALKETLANPRLLHSARLVKRGNQYYLMVNMECSRNNSLETVTIMGISRSGSGGLDYAICNKNGEITQSGKILEQPGPDFLYRYSNTIAKIAVDNRSQIVLEANGCKNDRVPVPSCERNFLFFTAQYAFLSNILKYKIPEKGLPAPIEVSANGLFLTCPNCGVRTQRNMVTDELFICIHCGYASESEWIGSENLAKKLLRYHSDKIPITIVEKDNCILCYNNILGFECKLSSGTTDYAQMYSKLAQFLKAMGGTFIHDSKKYSVWKKLVHTPNLENSIRLIRK